MTIRSRVRWRVAVFAACSFVAVGRIVELNGEAIRWLSGALLGFLSGTVLAKYKNRSWALYEARESARHVECEASAILPLARSAQRTVAGISISILVVHPYQELGVLACIVVLGSFGYWLRLELLR